MDRHGTNSISESYDEVLYPGYTHAQTHPDRLSTLARLFGMTPAPVERCRVLEIGCGDGSNLAAMAFVLSESEFTGIDRAGRPVAKGQEILKALGLKNIALRQFDLMELSPELGQFDYIIAHGLYSWVPTAVQDKILSLCKSYLAPQGVAFVSYNTFPGGHLRRMVREMMLFHVRDFSEPQQKINQAVALVKFLVESQPHDDTFSAFLKEELEQVLNYNEGHLYHDDLAEINSPVYFYQFMQHAAQHGLQFLAEADFLEMQYHIYPPQASETLHRMAAKDVILKEQYLDFLKCRKFRQTLLCHKAVALDHAWKPELVRQLYIASPAQPLASEPDLNSHAVEEFRGKKGAKVATDYPLAKAALWHLGQIYPQSPHFDKLLIKSRALAGLENYWSDAEREEEAQTLAQILLHVYATGMLELYPRAPDFVSEISQYPVASPLARLQIRQDKVVTNLRHAGVLVEGTLSQQLLLSLDGSRDRAALLEHLILVAQSGEATVQEHGAPVHDPQRIRELLSAELEKSLEHLARLSLLTS